MSTQEQTDDPTRTYIYEGVDAGVLGSTITISAWCKEAGYTPVLTFCSNGKVEVGPGLSPDEASQLAVASLIDAWAKAWPAMATKTMLDKLTPEEFVAAIAGRCKDCGTKTEGRTCHCTNDV